ncbi:MAG: TolC family protein [Ignavibacteriae bacterium]|nr:TolC family protein [Ignavibacteria bacterium]MBI3365020.1 TolC family protein [Ignavibacteriota bacterium]
MKLHRLFCLPVIVAATISVGAIARQKMSLTVEQAIATGLEKSKSLHASLMRVEAADAKASEVNAARLPSLRLGGSYARLSDVPGFEIGPFPPLLNDRVTISPAVFNNYNVKLSLQQPLFTGMRLNSSADIADYTSQATSQDYHRDRSELVYTIKASYWNLYKAIEFKKVIDENVEQMKAHLRDVQNMAAQGLVTKNEVLKVEVQLSNVQLQQIDARNNVQLAAIGLNNVIDIPLNTEIDLASTVQPESQKTYGNVNELVQQAIDRRYEVKSTELHVKASESAVTLARSGWFPQVFLTGNYYYARPNQRLFPTQDKFSDTWDVTLSVSLDIWNWGSTIHQTNQAQAQLAQVQDALGQLKDGIALEVTQSYLNFNQSRERIGVAEKGVSQAEENRRITNEKFKAGIALNSDLLDAEAALLQAKWNYIQSLVDHELADAKLQQAAALDEAPDKR